MNCTIKEFCWGFLCLIFRFLSTHMAASLFISGNFFSLDFFQKKQKRKCLKVHLAACRSVAPCGPAAEAAAAGEFLMAGQQRHTRAAAAAAAAVAFCSAIRNTSQMRPNGDPYLSRRQSFRTRRPIISLLVSRFALLRCSLSSDRQTHPCSQCRFCELQNASIDLDG